MFEQCIAFLRREAESRRRLDNCSKCGMAYPTESHTVQCPGPDNKRDIVLAQDRARNLVFNFNQEKA